MMTDPIADMLTRIRNAVRVERRNVEMPISKVKRGVAQVLKQEGYIWDWSEVENEPVAQLRIELKYGPSGEKVIRHLKRVSKPGCRVYSRSKDLRPILNGLGISILSTSQGVMSDRQARQKKVGGEVLCEVLLMRWAGGGRISPPQSLWKPGPSNNFIESQVMSRIGNQPVPILDGVSVKIDAGEISVDGPKGKLSYRYRPESK